VTDNTTAIYTSRIIKASALIADTKILLAEWDLDQSIEDNLDRAQRTNIFGKASRRRVRDILKIFRQRYFADPAIGKALATLVQAGASSQWIDPLLYFFSAQNDRTFRDAIVSVFYERHLSGRDDIPIDLVVRQIREWIAEEKTTTAWGDATILRVAQGIMATARDFGILQGSAHKTFSPIYLPAQSFALIALWLHQRERSGNLVLRSEEWRLFFVPVEGVERFFIEAHQEHLLAYYAAGSIVRLEFPVDTLEAYVHVLIESTR